MFIIELNAKEFFFILHCNYEKYTVACVKSFETVLCPKSLLWQ